MSRDLGKEIDQLKEEFQNLKNQMPVKKRERVTLSGPEAYKKLGKSKELKELALKEGDSGYITYHGFYRNQYFKNTDELENTDEAIWESSNISVDFLLNQDEKEVSLLLSSLSNKPRLIILKVILKRPSTAAELVERLGLGTTGQVYHHLKALEAADFITNEDGVFKFRGHRVQGFIMIMAGVSDIIDETFTKGRLEEIE